MDQAAAQIRALGVTEVIERLVFGEVVDYLSGTDAQIRLIVVGRRGQGEARAASHAGSNLERIVRSSHHPVLVVPGEPRPLRRFVVAYDASPNAKKIIDVLVEEPLLREVECIVLTVGEGAPHQQEQAGAIQRLREVGYKVNGRVVLGHADEVIAATIAETDADLLVMGANGHSRIRSLIIGSTTTALIRDSTIPLLIIR